MAFETHRSQSDCVPVTISNYFGVPYEDVVKRLQRRGWKDKGDGVNRRYYVPVIEEYLGRPPECLKPRRYQERYTGIARVGRSGRKNGHLTIFMDGYVFETDGRVYPLDFYRRWGWHLRCLWR